MCQRRQHPARRRRRPRAAAGMPAAVPPLTTAQVLSFKAEGFVVCPGLVDRLTTARWREQIWRALNASPDDPSTFAAAKAHPRLRGAGSDEGPVAAPALHTLPCVQAIVEQLADGNLKSISPDTELIINWGIPVQPKQQWSEPTDGHLDGYGGNRWGGGYMLGATCYLNDVEPEGGGFAYWPRS